MSVALNAQVRLTPLLSFCSDDDANASTTSGPSRAFMLYRQRALGLFVDNSKTACWCSNPRGSCDRAIYWCVALALPLAGTFVVMVRCLVQAACARQRRQHCRVRMRLAVLLEVRRTAARTGVVRSSGNVEQRQRQFGARGVACQEHQKLPRLSRRHREERRLPAHDMCALRRRVVLDLFGAVEHTHRLL